MASLAREVLRRIRKVLPESNHFYALHEPEFSGNELEYVSECIKTGWVSSAGKFVDRIEAQLAAYVGSKRAVAVVDVRVALAPWRGRLDLALFRSSRDDLCKACRVGSARCSVASSPLCSTSASARRSPPSCADQRHTGVP